MASEQIAMANGKAYAMPDGKSPSLPSKFGQSSFLELLPSYTPLPGEDVSRTEFCSALLASLRPQTPHQFLLAEHITANEWDLVHHRALRDRCVRQAIRIQIVSNGLNLAGPYDPEEDGEPPEPDLAPAALALNLATETHFRTKPYENLDAARKFSDLADRVLSESTAISDAAINELDDHGMDIYTVISDAQGSANARFHESQIKELEIRRRQVMADYRDLQAVHPTDAEVISE